MKLFSYANQFPVWKHQELKSRRFFWLNYCWLILTFDFTYLSKLPRVLWAIDFRQGSNGLPCQSKEDFFPFLFSRIMNTIDIKYYLMRILYEFCGSSYTCSIIFVYDTIQFRIFQCKRFLAWNICATITMVNNNLWRFKNDFQRSTYRQSAIYNCVLHNISSFLWCVAYIPSSYCYTPITLIRLP